VVLVGGASRTPALRAMLRGLFPELPELCISCDADTAVAQGLAIRGSQSPFIFTRSLFHSAS
jgi:molecular chaperone DnaK (HSP70)